MADQPCDAKVRAGRMDKARQFLLANQLVETFADEEEVADACVTLCACGHCRCGRDLLCPPR